MKSRASAAHDSKITLRCDGCGEEFRVFPSRASYRYCSPGCKRDAHIKYRTGKTWSSTVVVCDYCGAEVRKPNSRIHDGSRQFCNNRCYHAWDQQHKSTDIERERMRQRTLAMLASGTFVSPSGVEDRVAVWLEAHGLAFDRQVSVARRYAIDFRVGETLIEVNGDYWHGWPGRYPDPSPAQRKRQARDKWLATYCRNRGIPLLVIWEHEVRAGDFSALAPLLHAPPSS